MSKFRAQRTTVTGLLIVLVAAVLLTGSAQAADGPQPPNLGDDYSVQMVDEPSTNSVAPVGYQDVAPSDPLGIVIKAPFVRRYSLDTDHWQVFRCGNPSVSIATAVDILSGYISDYYASWSDGSLDLSFVAGVTLTPTSGDPNCRASAASAAASSIEGIFIITNTSSGGFASPGLICSTGDTCDWVADTVSGGNGRYVVIGNSAFLNYPQITVHELGHTLHWPHSNAGGADRYDNPIDVMSANSGSSEAFGTTVYNRYLSGWVDPSDVVVYSSGLSELTLQPGTETGTQMLVIDAPVTDNFYVVGARTSSAFDPISSPMVGVEVYLIDHNTCDGWGGAKPCPSLWREHITQPAVGNSLDHVYGVGESFQLGEATVSVTGRSAEGFQLQVIDDASSALPFIDIADSIFINEISWLRTESITLGCNPPTNDRFCPSAFVNRGQMAAFLTRALGLTDQGTADFTDDDGTLFENDIEKLATAGITLGCNPPTNDRFCPSAFVNRGQMAAFLTRALGLTDQGTADFTDDDGTLFENDIEKLATAGITLGCNPPTNDRFCPKALVTREQMAAFLNRALTP